MSERLKIHEIYLSIQGESTHAGLPCVFVRTTGCPLRCVWCDTEHAFYEGEDTTVDAVFDRVISYGTPMVEITGGEPLVQPAVLPLMTRLCDAGRTVLIETAGAHDIGNIDPRVRIIMDIKCPGSGESERNLWSNLGKLKTGDEIKFVLADRDDYVFARDVIERHELAGRCEILMSTVFGAIERADVVQWILEDRLPVRFQLQTHKFIWPADQRGV